NKKGRQSGFTLVEIAIVLVIIGLLLGGIIQGQQLINSARVKNLAETNSGVQAAYFGFIDRYRQVPGDMPVAIATNAIGVTITGGGNGDGRLTNDPGGAAYDEQNAAWEHLSKSGFIQGSYAGTSATTPNFSNNLSPVNAFNNPMVLGLTPDYFDTQTTPPARLHLIIGRGIPVGILRELDVKVDDGNPISGVLRATLATSTIFAGGTPQLGGSAATCVTAAAPFIYNVAGDSPDCNGVFLF
ncbi:MAG: prepilin-type N-terminal cleavage/methylation domain-containing protein, partial [Chromatiales bacterium]|nr:prepilin-type N-terminal cleavage/methylation domain-containing protein [Chromatiales bacterium]